MTQRTMILSLILIGAIGALALVVDAIVPKPNAATARIQIGRQERKKLNELETKSDELRKTQALVTRLTWPGPLDTIHPRALANVTQATKRHQLRLITFRPQRTITESEYTRVPYLVTLEGSFPALVAFLRSYQGGSGKLAVTSVQVTSSDQATDRVAATVGFVGLMKGGGEPATTNTKRTSRG